MIPIRDLAAASPAAFLRLPFVLLLSLALSFASTAARGRYLDEVEVDTAGTKPIIRVRFNVNVQYLRHVPESQGKDLQIFLRQVSGGAIPPVAEETKTIPETERTPRFIVIYPFQNGVPTKMLQIKFDKLVRYQVRQGMDARSIDIIVEAPAEIVTRPAKPTKPPTPVGPARYAIALDTFATAEQAAAAVVPPELAGYQVFVSMSDIAGVPLYDRYVGYFDTREGAEAVRIQVAARYPHAQVLDALTRPTIAAAQPRPAPIPESKSQPRTGSAPKAGPPKTAAMPAPLPTPDPKAPPPKVGTTPRPPAASLPPAAAVPSAPSVTAPAATGSVPPASQSAAAPSTPVTAVTATPEVERQASDSMEKAKGAFAENKWDEVINQLNKLLLLPPNSLSQQAQEMIGLARDRSGQLGKAKAEYELYLKLYPDSEGGQRVRRRLVLLEERLVALPADSNPLSESVERQAPLKSVYGSFAQYYYDGKTKFDTAFNTPTGVDQASLTNRDLSAIVTTADANARYRSERSDIRLVFRDTNTRSLIDKNPSRNRLDAAYVDYRGLQDPYSLRLGRQIGTTGGILGRFDGAIAGYKFVRNWRINAVAGQPVDYGLDSKRYFYGLNLDVENILDYWSGNAYGIRQVVDGIPDRDAVGGEIRYFKNGNSLYSTVDYDTLFEKVNIATIQGSVQTKGQTTFTLLYDQRKAPPLATTNAVFGQPVTSIETLLQTYSEEQLRQQALAITADVKQVLASVTTPVNESWQLGADYRLTSVGPLPAFNEIPATPGTGNIHGITLQAIGSNLYSNRDINVFSTTWLKSETFHGESIYYSNLTGVGEKWTLEPSLRLYHQTDAADVNSTRYTATLRITYAWKQYISFEGEYDAERSYFESPLQKETATQQFFYAGYRVTF